MRTWSHAFFSLALSAVASTSTASAQAAVILVRHAEKATVGGADPSLSELGQMRAKALAATLANANVTAIVTTTFKRTFETASVLASELNIPIEKVAIEGGTPAHVSAIAAAVRKHAGGTVLVVGHSNTIPAIVTALGGPKLPDLCDSNYATLFHLVPGKDGKASMVRTRYGANEPEGSEGCANSMK
ncbi:MAG: histidine phosphatase family protein [Phycisphaerae bacterium]|nr:histidine phosphatase family protein [Gemmatimonadaceae bacterium]